jgi:signal peptidase II
VTGSDPPATAPPRSSRTGLFGLMAAVVVATVAVDQATKSWAVAALADGPRHVVWTLELDLAFNPGLAFSQGTGLTGLITVVGLVLAGLVWWSRGITSPPLAVGVALLVGGACGNLADRLFRDHGGAVVDFIDFQWWPVFNVADMAVFCGAAVLVVASVREPST